MLNPELTYIPSEHLTNKLKLMWCEECLSYPADKVISIKVKQKKSSKVVESGTKIWLCTNCYNSNFANKIKG